MAASSRKYKEITFTVTATVVMWLFLMSKVDLGGVVHVARGVDAATIILCLALSLIGNIFFAACRWKAILKELEIEISLKESLFIKMGSSALISFLPFRSGEATRLIYLKRVRNVDLAKGTVSVLVEYLIKVLAIAACVLAGLMLWGYHASYPGAVSQVFRSRYALCFTAALSSRLPGMTSTEAWKAVIKNCLQESIRALKAKEVLVFTALFFIAEISIFFFLSRALAVELPYYVFLTYVPLVIFFGGLPLTVAGLGTREVAVLVLFLRYASPETLVSLGVLFYLIDHLFPLVVSLCTSGHFVHAIVRAKKEGPVDS